MKNRNSIALFVAVFATSACATTAPSDHAHDAPLASTTLKAADGSTKGKAWIAGSDGHWEMKIEANDLPAGAHGAHLHMIGKCDAPDFASAGGHLNPHHKMHGAENPQGKHLGDLPNVTIAGDGTGSLSVALEGTAAELETALFDADGTAVVIHAGPDDYRTDPSGNSGGRIACGVLTRG